MRRLVVLLALFAPAAAAQQAPSREGMRAACAADVQRLCPSAAGNTLRMRSCILENQARIEPRCREALVAAGQMPASTGPPANPR
jgi:hypothetical protein